MPVMVGAGEVDFGRDVKPILSANCFACHGPDQKARKADLRLDTREGATAGDAKKAAVVPGKPELGQMMARLGTDDPDEQMPPPRTGKKLSAGQVEVIRRWIEQGAKWGEHWSFVPPVRPVPLDVRQREWPISAIDRFVLARLEREKMTPSPQAERAALLRRVYFDLIGLPPAPAELDAFVADESPDAYAKVVDRLLASPAFGEKWAVGWLDLARYADSNGYQRDGFRTIWPWRDWVIRAMNADMPYDQFVTRQIAGDLLAESADTPREQSAKVATGLFRNVMVNVEAGTVPEADRVKQVADRVNMFGTIFLGLTLECAQCHNHKYDPISTRDYYRLFAYFNNTPIESKYRGKDVAALDFVDGPAMIVDGSKEDLAQREQLQGKLSAMLADCGQDEPDKKTLAQIRQLEKQIESIPLIASLVLEEMPAPRQTHVLKRGQFDDPAEEVSAGVPEALGVGLAADGSANRVALAKWTVDPRNPLTARVAVNRWWAEIFGRGLVSTIEDFGAQGEAPSHPELLDWLAVELRDNGWSMKRIIRQIVLSRTYQQSARVTPQMLKTDPGNVLLARGPRQRLAAEAIRDHALSAAGLRSEKMFGPPVFPPQPPKLWRVTGKVDNTYRTSTGEDRYRRGIYTIWRRSAPYPSFLNFDATERSSCVVKRARSNTPLQALTLLNDPVYVEAAEALSKRLMAEAADPSARVRLGYRLCLTRGPRESELDHLLQVYEREKSSRGEEAAWGFVATVLINLDEAISK